MSRLSYILCNNDITSYSILGKWLVIYYIEFYVILINDSFLLQLREIIIITMVIIKKIT